MKQTTYRMLSRLAGMGLLCVGMRALAQDAVTASLLPSPTGGIHAMVAQKLSLSSERPAGITHEPTYDHKPQYGVIRLGDAKNNQIVVVLDTAPGSSRPHLYVDANGDGDLTNDPPVNLVVQPSATTGKGTRTVSSSTDDTRWVAIAPVEAHYDLPGRAGKVLSSLQFTLWGGDVTYNREYNRTGVLKIGTRSYPVTLVDQGVNGLFNDFKHGDDESAKVVLLIDRKGTGTFDPRRDAFDAAKPFRLGAGVYEVSSIDPRGTEITLKRSGKSAHGLITAADLRVGSEMIDFEATTTRDQTVHFPDDYKGKIVLLDFWATWCPPCREEVPNIVAAYNQYHSAGFDILGISLDQANKAQTLASYTRQTGMSWPEVYDGGFWKAEIAVLYNINAIPMSYLVDGDTGTILAMGDSLRGPGLQAEIEKALQRRHH